MDVYEIRKLRLRLLIRAAGGLIKTVAEAVGTDANHLSAILSDRSKAQMGSELARRFESAYHTPPGWMDTAPEHALLEILDGLPDQNEKELLNFARYTVERAAQNMDPGAVQRYLNMIDDMLISIDERLMAAEPATSYDSDVKPSKRGNGK